MVIADVSVTCTRVKTYGLRYSSPYLATNSGLMIRRGTQNVRGPDDLGGRKVCSGTGTTNIDDMIDFAAAQRRNGKTPLVPVSAADTSECLMLLQRGQIDAIYTDVLVLEGFRQQDPGTVLLDYRAPRNATTAIAMSDRDDDLVRFVNGVLDQMRADGSLLASYQKWFGNVPGLLPLPPVRYSG
jgi:polar amino acid transport system substrate-binding protein